MNVVLARFFWWSLLGLFLIITLTAQANRQAISDTPQSARIVSHKKTTFASITLLQVEDKLYKTKAVPLSVGTLVYPITWTIVAEPDPLNSFQKYDLGKNIVATVELTYTPQTNCDLLCYGIRVQANLLREMDTNWNTSLCQLSLSCSDTVVFAKSLVIGGSGNFSESLKKDLILNALYHVVVVSGFQVGIIALLLERSVSRLFLPVIPRFLIIISALTVYAVITGFEPPVERSLVTITLALLLQLFFGRELKPMLGLVYGSILMLLFQPYLVYSISFLLSIAAVLGVLAAETILSRLPKNIFVTIVVTLVFTTLTTLPITSSFGNAISVVAFVANCIILPLIPLLTLLSFLASLPVIGFGFGILFYYLSHLIFWVLHNLSILSTTTSLGIKFEQFTTVETIAWYLCIGIFLIGFVLFRRPLTKPSK